MVREYRLIHAVPTCVARIACPQVESADASGRFIFGMAGPAARLRLGDDGREKNCAAGCGAKDGGIRHDLLMHMSPNAALT